MGAAENAQVVRRGYEAFSTGDMATLSELFAEDAVWNVAGTGVLSGPKHGREAIIGHFGELFSRSDGTVRVTLHDVVSGDDHTVGVQSNHAERNGKVIDADAVLVFHLRDGQVTEVQEYGTDTARMDDFWA
jgi:hypothetical protein